MSVSTNYKDVQRAIVVDNLLGYVKVRAFKFPPAQLNGGSNSEYSRGAKRVNTVASVPVFTILSKFIVLDSKLTEDKSSCNSTSICYLK